LVERNAFSKLSGGRAQGQENVHNHYRKGVSGDWQDHLTQAHLDHFYELTGDTLEILGYER